MKLSFERVYHPLLLLHFNRYAGECRRAFLPLQRMGWVFKIGVFLSLDASTARVVFSFFFFSFFSIVLFCLFQVWWMVHLLTLRPCTKGHEGKALCFPAPRPFLGFTLNMPWHVRVRIWVSSCLRCSLLLHSPPISLLFYPTGQSFATEEDTAQSGQRG